MGITDYLNRGLMFRKRRQWKRATECFRAVTEAVPDDPLGWYYLAVTLDNRGQEGEAIPAYQRALTLGLDAQRERNAWAWLGSSLRKTGQPEAALACFEKAEVLGYSAVELLGFRGWALMALGCFDYALSAFDRATQLEPRNPAYWRGRYKALRHLNRGTEAAIARVNARRLEAKLNL